MLETSSMELQIRPIGPDSPAEPFEFYKYNFTATDLFWMGSSFKSRRQLIAKILSPQGMEGTSAPSRLMGDESSVQDSPDQHSFSSHRDVPESSTVPMRHGQIFQAG
jgi:hypothetical protein